MRYEDINSLLIERVPEFADEYAELMEWWSKDESAPPIEDAHPDLRKWWTDGMPGSHNVFGDLVNPFLLEQLPRDPHDDRVRRIFELLEEMAGAPDPQVQEVAAFTVLEALFDSDHAKKAAISVMGPATRRLMLEVEASMASMRSGVPLPARDPSLDSKVLAFFKEMERELAGAARLEIQDAESERAPEAPPGIYVALHPVRPEAASVSAYVIGEGWINVELGQACIVELLDQDEESLLESVRAFVQAVVSGNFQETVWTTGPNVRKAKGLLDVDGKVHRIYYRQAGVSLFGVGKGGKRHYDYAPYRPAVTPE